MTEAIINLKDEVKLITALNKLFKEQIPEDNLNLEGMTEDIGYMTEDNILMLICKTQRAKEIFKRFTNKHIKQQNIPKLVYSITEKEQGITNISRYNTEYLLRILNILKYTFDSVDISLKRDYPITLETEHFKIILAPKMFY
jgi:hypothetical protein